MGRIIRSCTKFIADTTGEHFGFQAPELANLVHWAVSIDGAQYPDIRTAVEMGGRRAGFFAAILSAFSSFLTQYAEETQPYELMALLALLATAGFVQGFAHRRRRWLWLFAAALTLMLYT